MLTNEDTGCIMYIMTMIYPSIPRAVIWRCERTPLIYIYVEIGFRSASKFGLGEPSLTLRQTTNVQYSGMLEL